MEDILKTFGLVNDVLIVPKVLLNNLSDISNRTRAKNRALKEQVEILSKRLEDVSPEVKLKFYLKISILKNLAWKDGKLHTNEKEFLFDFIINTNEVPNDEKIILLKDILKKPSKNIFKKMFSKEPVGKGLIFKSYNEANDFNQKIKELAGVDGDVDKKEQEYINKIAAFLQL